MTRRARIPSLFLALVAWALCPSAWAQALNTLKIDLWPEYDQPGVLVIYHAEAPASAQQDGRVIARLPMPASAGEPSAVAYRTAEGKLVLAQYTRTVQGDVAWIDLNAGSPQLRLEFYQPLDSSQPQRVFQFHWPQGIAIGSMGFEVMEPLGSTGFQVWPAPGSAIVSQEGETLHAVSIGPVPADRAVDLDLKYTRHSDLLTVDLLRQMQAMSQPAPGSQTSATPTAGATDGLSKPGLLASAPAPRTAASSGANTRLWVTIGAVLVILIAGFMLSRPVKKP